MGRHATIFERLGEILIIYLVTIDKADQDSKIVMTIYSFVSARSRSRIYYM